MNILNDQEYYENINDKSLIRIEYYSNGKKIIISKAGLILSEKQWNLIKNDFKFSHKIRVVSYYSEKYKQFFELSRNLKNWSHWSLRGKLWGAYNRAYNLNLEEIEKEYQKLIRYNKLKNILNEKN